MFFTEMGKRFSYYGMRALLIIALAPLMALVWTALGKRGDDPPAAFRFGIGLVLVGSGFLVLLLGAGSGTGGATPAMFLVLLHVFHSVET